MTPGTGGRGSYTVGLVGSGGVTGAGSAEQWEEQSRDGPLGHSCSSGQHGAVHPPTRLSLAEPVCPQQQLGASAGRKAKQT